MLLFGCRDSLQLSGHKSDHMYHLLGFLTPPPPPAPLVVCMDGLSLIRRLPLRCVSAPELTIVGDYFAWLLAPLSLEIRLGKCT